MEHLDLRRKVTIMVAIMATMLFASLNQTIVGTALPRIIAELGGMEYYSWIFTIYMLTSSITTILVGKLSDMYGRKPFILIGIGIFILGSFLSGLSTTIVQLIVFRGIQGFGAGMIMSTAFAAIGDLFAPRERGRWQGLMTAVFGLSSVLGPTLGGYIVDHAPWHWVFWIFLPVGVVAFAMIMALFPKTPRRERQTIDYFGSLFLTLSMVPLLLAFSWAGTKYTWGSQQILGLFGAAAAALLIFMFIEKRNANPVLPLFLFKNSVFTLSNLVNFTMGAGMFGAIMYMPYFVQGVMGISATESGYITMPMTLSLVAGSILGGQIISRLGKYKWLAIFGLVIMTFGMYLLFTMNPETTRLHAVLFMLPVGLGLGFAMPVFTLTVQNAVEQKNLGVATSSAQLFRSLGGTIGVAVMGTVMAHRMASKMQELTASGGADLSKIPADTVAQLAKLKDPQVLLNAVKLKEIHDSLPVPMQAVFVKLVASLREALSYALSGVFLTGGIIVLTAVVLTFFLKEIPLRTSAKRMQTAVKEAAVAPGEEPLTLNK